MNRPSPRWLFFVWLFFVSSSAFATNFSSTQSGSWSSASTWGGTGVPSGTDNVTINAGHTVTLAAPTTITDLTINGGTLDQSGSTMAVSGTLTFTSGTITGAVAFDMNGASFAWSGGTLSGAGGFNLGASTTTSITGLGGLADGRAIANSGTINAAGSFRTRNGATINNNFGATITMGDVLVGWDGNGGVGSITNSGTVAKTSGTGNGFFGIGAPISDSGDIEAQSGTLLVDSAVTGSGLPTFYATTASSTMTFSTSGNSFPTSTVFDGLGTISISANSTFTGTLVATAATFALDNGTQTFSSASLTGTITFDSGTLTGSLTIPSSATMKLKTAGSHLLDGAAITNQGLIDCITAGFSTRNGSTLANSGTIDFEGDYSIVWDGNGGIGSITNDGTIAKVSGTGTSALGNFTPVSGIGTYHAQSGTLRFSGATTSSSSTIFNADSGTMIEFTVNGNSFASGTSFNGSGAYRLASNSAFASGSITVAGGLTIEGGATISFNGLTIIGTTTWNNATFTGSGLTIPSGSTLNVLTASTHMMDGGTITNNGTVNCSAACISSRNASSFTNNASGAVNIAGDFFFGWDGNGGIGAIINDGTLTKSAGTGTATYGNFASLSGGGTYHAQSGTLQINAGITTSTATVFNADSGTTIKFAQSGNAFASGTSFNGTGAYDLSGGSTFNGGTITIAGSLTMNAGATQIFNGVTINGATTWNNTTIKGTGLTIPSGSTLTVATAATHLIDSGTLLNSGTIDCSGECMHMRNGSIVTNQAGATINVAGDYAFAWDGNGGIGAIGNDGSILKTSGTGTSLLGNGAVLSNTGLIRVQSGTLTVSSAIANAATGVLKIDDGATMEFTASGNTFASGTSFATPGSGTGLARIANSSQFTGTITAATQFRLDNGTIAFSSATFNGALEWKNATVTGALTIPASSSFTISAGSHTLDGGSIDDFATWTVAAGLGARNGSTITIESGALLDLTVDATFGYDGNGGIGSITNSGTIRKSAGTGTTFLGNGSPVTNNNLIRAMSGTLQLNTTTSNAAAGTLQADSGTSLILSGSGNTIANGSTLVDNGAIQIGNTTTWNGAFTISGTGSTLITAGTHTFASASYTGALQMSGATLTGSGSGLTIPSGSSLTTNSGCCLLSNGLTITNGGTITLGQSISYRNGGGITNNSGALIDMQGDFGAAWDGNGSFPTMSINGTLRKSSGTGTSTWSCGSACSVPGAIEAKIGTINFGNGLTLSGTSTITSTILGTTAGSGYGVVSSTSAGMTLAGTIGASVPGPFIPQGGQQYTVVTFPSASGSFTNASISFGTGRSFTVSQSASNVKLTTSGPTITSIAPNAGTEFGGTSVSINGSGFASGGSFGVTFGGTAATCSVTSASLITCTTPAHATGTVDVIVTNADGQPTTSTNAFTFESSPFVSTFRNSSGGSAGGGAVIFEGNNLGSVTTVTFGGTSGTIIYSSSTSLTVAAPAHVAGTVDIVLTNGSGSTTLTSAFTYIDNDDLARDFSVAVNPSPRWRYGMETSRGAAFSAYGTFGRTSGAFDAWNPTGLPLAGRNSSASPLTQATNITPSMKVELHPGSAGENSVVRWTAASAGPYRISGYFVGLDSSYPTTTDVAILKNNSTASTLFATNINSYNVPQTFSVDQTLNAGDTIEFTVGFGTNGNFSGDGTGVDATIAPLTGPAVTVTSVSPASGTAGTSLTIGGTNFHSGASVTVGGSACSSVTVVNANTITCTAPSHANGAVDVVVTHTDSAAATLTNGFTYVSNDMAVTTGASVANALTNSTFHYTIALSNAGTATATGMTMHASVTNATIASITSSGAITCSNTTTTVDCSAASFTTSDTGNVDVTVTAASSPATSSITATVTASSDSNATNDSSATSVNVVSQFATETVTSNADSGANTLRQAILDANNNVCGPICTINFALPSNARTIALSSALPAVTASVLIDGTTQSGYSGSPLITLDGTADTTNGMGVALNGGNSTLRGLAIVHFHNYGVAIGGTGNSTVAANFIGIDTTNTAAANLGGILVTSNGNTIGGASAAARNVIGGNTNSGIAVDGASNTTISNNDVGTDPTGSTAMPNGQDGIQIANNASNTTIGNNVIAGNSVSGVYVTTASSTTIVNNLIGVNAASNAVVGNALAGIYTDNNATSTTITGNTIGGSPHGIRNAGSGTALHITGNFIGTNAAQTLALPNTIGVQLQSFTNDNVVGGANAGEPNVIARNSGDGVIVYSTGNEIIDNAIYGNGALGIDLQPGANNNQPAPVITSAVISGANLIVNYTANASVGTQSIRIDFFKADASGQGKTFLFSVCAASTNNTASSTTINASSIGVAVGDSLVALATSIGDPNCGLTTFGDGTSPFSAATTIACTPPSAQINAPASACANASALAANIVSPTAGSSYNWTITNGTLTSGQGTTSITYTAGATGSVQLAVTVTNGSCTSNGNATTAINPPPSATITAPSAMCAGAAANASVAAQPAATYAWSITNGTITGGTRTNAITFTAATSGSVSLGITVTLSGCSATSGAVVSINSATPQSITAPPSVCANGSASASVPSQAGFTYSWSITNGAITSGATSNAITFTAGASGSVSVSVTTTVSSCSATTNATIPINAPPSPIISAPATVCANATANASVAAQAGATYAWTITNGTINSGQGTNAINFTAGTSGTVVLSMSETLGGCSGSASHSVTINPAPAVSISGPASVCPNTTATLDAGAGFTSYAWSTGATTQTITVPAGTYSVTVTNASGCSASATKTVATSSTPLATITAPASVLPNSTGNTAAVSSGPAGTTYTWTIANGTITAGAGTNSITFTAGPAGTVNLGITVNSNGCTATGNASVTIGAFADLALAMSASQSSVNPGSPISFTITVANNGPSDATNVTLTNSLSGTASGNGWTCASTTCTRPLLAANTSSTITLNLTAPQQATTLTNSATVSASTSDSHLSNNSASSSVVVNTPTCSGSGTPVALTPSNTTTSSPVTFTWQAATQAVGYRLWISVDGGAAQDLGTTDGATSLKVDIPGGTIVWFVDALFAGCSSTRSNSLTFTVPKPAPCANSATSLVAPANNTTSNASTIQFTWTAVANASGYRLWASIDNGDFNALGTTTSTTLTHTFSFGHVVWYVETLFDGCNSIESAHNAFDITKAQNCGTAVAQLLSPDDNSTTTNANVTFSWSPVQGATSYEVWLALNNASPVLLGSTTSTTLTKEVPAGVLEWFVRANFDGCDPRDSAHRHFTYAQPASCSDAHPLLIAPLNNTTTFSPVNLSWKEVAGATSYKVLISRDGGDFTTLIATQATHVDNATIQPGSIDWMVEASFGNNCAPTTSSTSHFVVLPQPQGCVTPGAPAIFAPSATSSNITYLVRWQKVAGGTSYTIQESPTADFASPTSNTTTNDNAKFTHANSGTYYYRVRASNDCTTQPGPFSSVVAIVILPPTNLTGAIPSDQTQNVTYTIPLASSLAGFSFTATPNEPWLTVTSSSGTVPANGLTLTVVANTTGLPLGTSVGGITITTNAPTTTSHASTKVTTNTTSTVSVSLVQPVQSKSNTAPPPDALIIPAVAHADGINSKFQSDVRVTNTAPQTMKYQVTFTPSGDNGAANAKQTTIDVDPGKTIALDDVLGTFFTSGAIGTLEVRPLTQLASNIANLLTFASSRTFNATSNGTFGQYIPAIPFANFIGNAKNPILSLQQIAQSDAYRTNLGLVEGSGNPASVLVSVFGGDGKKITDFPIALTAGEHTQFSLAQHNVNVSDGRVEVKVTSSTGKVTAYASVLDNLTNDPMLVNPITITEGGGTKFVIPGVADLNNGFANWRTDTRIYNASASTVTANLLFYSQTGAAPVTKSITLAPNEVKQLDNTLASFFGVTNDGGALHITTDTPANLITSARTYNQTTNGTYGQFINGITPNDAAAAGGRALQILQVEESDRYRSNIGVAEVNGKPATVELQVVPADGRVAAKLTFDMKPNEFRQFNSLLQGLNVGTTYNARVTVRVVSGEGRIAAYASVIDALTNDPTFVPAQ